MLALFALPGLYGQGCANPPGPSGGVSSLSPGLSCAQVQVPQGRKFVILTTGESYSYWKNGSGCALANCSAFNLNVTLSGPGVNESVAFTGSPASAPPGSGWSSPGVGTQYCSNQGCVDCVTASTAPNNVCTFDYPPARRLSNNATPRWPATFRLATSKGAPLLIILSVLRGRSHRSSLSRPD